MLGRSPGALTTGDYGGVIGDDGKKGSAVCGSVAVGEERAARGKRRRVPFRAGGTGLLERSRDGISRTRMRWSITPIGCLNSAEARGYCDGLREQAAALNRLPRTEANHTRIGGAKLVTIAVETPWAESQEDWSQLPLEAQPMLPSFGSSALGGIQRLFHPRRPTTSLGSE